MEADYLLEPIQGESFIGVTIEAVAVHSAWSALLTHASPGVENMFLTNSCRLSAIHNLSLQLQQKSLIIIII